MTYKTEQEKFWSGEFGDDYIGRNQGDALIASNTAFFTKILASTKAVGSVIEFGSNIGMNLRAIKTLLPEAKFSAVEINEKAVNTLKELGFIDVYHSSILEFKEEVHADLSLIKGVLIHINPNELGSVYDVLYRSSNRYICVAEYYSPTPAELSYRGHEGKLFKRDFAGEILDRYPDLSLVDYGFAYHRDAVFPQGDITWFLLEKKSS